MREVDRVELRQMSGIDEAQSDADTQAELQQDKLIPSCSLCFFASMCLGRATKAVCLVFMLLYRTAAKISTNVQSLHNKFFA